MSTPSVTDRHKLRIYPHRGASSHLFAHWATKATGQARGVFQYKNIILPERKFHCVEIRPFNLHIRISYSVNTLRPRQNGRHFADDIFKGIFLNKNAWIPIKISLKFVPQGPIKNIPALVQIMAWRRPGDKPLSGPMMVGLTTHIWVTRPQWVKMKSLYRISSLVLQTILWWVDEKVKELLFLCIEVL